MSVMDRAADVEDAFRDLLNDLDIATRPLQLRREA